MTVIRALLARAVLFVAGFGFMLKYWMDKWAILQVYMKPPLYGHQLFDGFEEIWFCFGVTGPSYPRTPPLPPRP